LKKFMLLPLLIFGLVISAFGFPQANAASNNQDTAFSFIFGTDVVQRTPAREKLNYTSAYMKATSIGGPGYYRAHVTLADGTNVSNGYIYTISKNKEVFLRNWAGEWYGLPELVRIQANPAGLVPYSASGVWSPDSVQ
jgi:hypothetical protein